jgi:hypothetical protein
MNIQLNSHDALGKLSIVKNYLSVLQSDETLSESQKKLITPALQSSQELIDQIKELTQLNNQ